MHVLVWRISCRSRLIISYGRDSNFISKRRVVASLNDKLDVFRWAWLWSRNRIAPGRVNRSRLQSQEQSGQGEISRPDSVRLFDSRMLSPFYFGPDVLFAGTRLEAIHCSIIYESRNSGALFLKNIIYGNAREIYNIHNVYLLCCIFSYAIFFENITPDWIVYLKIGNREKCWNAWNNHGSVRIVRFFFSKGNHRCLNSR